MFATFTGLFKKEVVKNLRKIKMAPMTDEIFNQIMIQPKAMVTVRG